jgi:peptidoglycan/xylan/chitin deacetylase (PgdA/CDA1 family)
MAILCYHGVEDGWSSPLALAPEQFARHCDWLGDHRRVVGLGEAIDRLDDGARLSRGTTLLTFDDGFAGLHQHALPVLRQRRLPATVFLVAGTLAGSGTAIDWVDDPPATPLRTLSRNQVLEMQQTGISFGSHSFSHRDLTSLTEADCERDLRASRELLEDLLAEPIRWLAYPRGLHNEGVRRAAARAGFTHGFTLPQGPEPVSALALPRVGIWAHDGLNALRIKSADWYLTLRTGAGFPLVRALRGVRRLRPAV